jgi:cysteinyl-tRNA synthetase
MEYLGESFDIHTGGEDNIFPHHEAEIAQSESSTGKPFARYWIHTRFLLVNGKKMSKSKGNFLTLQDIQRQNYSLTDLRITFLQSHYRSQMNFTWESIAQAKTTREKLTSLLSRLSHAEDHDTEAAELPESLTALEKQFTDAMDADLNTPEALRALLDIVTTLNTLFDARTPLSINSVKLYLERLLSVLGLEILMSQQRTQDIPDEVLALAQKRHEAREQKDFATADELRKKIENLGYSVKDTDSSYVLEKTQ